MKMNRTLAIINYKDATTYIVLFVSTIFVNKYVLSVLEFTYPTIYQGWQTLVGFLLLKLLTLIPINNKNGLSLQVTPMDRSGFINLLPQFIFFVGAIVAGSKALSVLPIPVILAVSNLLPSTVFLLDNWGQWLKNGFLSFAASMISIVSAVLVIIIDLDLTFSDVHYVWLLVHVVCTCAQYLYGRIADVRYSETDKLYYCYIFSVVVLTPSSLYLEEAFQVLRFRYRRQFNFYVLCVLSGVFSVGLNLWGWFVNIGVKTTKCDLRVTITENETQALAKCVASTLAILAFPYNFGIMLWVLIALNLASTVFIPVQKTTNGENVLDI